MAAPYTRDPYEYDELLDRVERLQEAARELAQDIRERANEDRPTQRRRYR